MVPDASTPLPELAARANEHDQEAWRWGRVHPLVFPHALGAANPFFAKIFNRRLEVGGAQETVAQHELPCYTGTYGLFHTGTGATTDAKGNPGPTCDSAVSSAPSDREVFTLGTSIAAVAEGAIGRMNTDDLQP